MRADAGTGRYVKYEEGCAEPQILAHAYKQMASIALAAVLRFSFLFSLVSFLHAAEQSNKVRTRNSPVVIN